MMQVVAAAVCSKMPLGQKVAQHIHISFQLTRVSAGSGVGLPEPLI
jgi:hypothetical protein